MQIALQNFETSLQREKFLIFDSGVSLGPTNPVVALSNRMALTLGGADFVVRAQNMHGCARFAAYFIRQYIHQGAQNFDLSACRPDSGWEATLNDYETAHNPRRFATLYTGGKPIFATGTNHPFFDVIENCAHKRGDYNAALPLAMSIFEKMGKNIRIESDSNVALTLNIESGKIRCGVIFRGPRRTATFHFFIPANPQKPMLAAMALETGAAFLEGIQLCFYLGSMDFKISRGEIDPKDPLMKQIRAARLRLGRIRSEISDSEESCDIRYRPEKPDFDALCEEALEIAQSSAA